MSRYDANPTWERGTADRGHQDYSAGTVEVPALRGISLNVPARGFAMIVGPSGSGKTTLLNLVG